MISTTASVDTTLYLKAYYPSTLTDCHRDLTPSATLSISLKFVCGEESLTLTNFNEILIDFNAGANELEVISKENVEAMF